MFLRRGAAAGMIQLSHENAVAPSAQSGRQAIACFYRAALLLNNNSTELCQYD
jgi:hypothetical protein